jgi:hypothetical protein
VQLRLDLQYPAFRLYQDVLQLVGIHRRHPPGLPVLPLPTCCPPSPCTRLSRARTTTRTPPRPDAVNRRRACPPPDWMPGGKGGTRALPTFTTIRSTSEPPSSTPAASPRLRRRPSTWPPHRRIDPASESPPPIAVACTAPGPYPPDWSRHNDYGASDTDSSRTASRLACRTRTVWQCQHVPAALTLPRVSAVGLPSASSACCDRPEAGVSHPSSEMEAPRGAPRLRCRASSDRAASRRARSAGPRWA